MPQSLWEHQDRSKSKGTLRELQENVMPFKPTVPNRNFLIGTFPLVGLDDNMWLEI